MLFPASKKYAANVCLKSWDVCETPALANTFRYSFWKYEGASSGSVSPDQKKYSGLPFLTFSSSLPSSGVMMLLTALSVFCRAVLMRTCALRVPVHPCAA